MLTLNDGRSELWQWDTGRKLTVDADCSQVHFSNKVFGRSIDIDVIDGVVTIPDVLLQVDKELTAWAFVGTPENGYTKNSKVFKVNKRNKPADYVFTPPEQTTLGEILERLEDIESAQDPNAIKNAVDGYLANNPIEETDPTVPEWAKKPNPPDVKIPDKLPNPHTLTFAGAVNASYDGSSAVEIEIPDYGGNVAYDEEQKLTEEQKERARTNIGAQPVGAYLTEVPEGYAKNEDIEKVDRKVDTLREVVSKFHSNIVEAASGDVIAVSDASVMELAGLRIFGKTTQNGTPTPDAPAAIESVGDSGSVTVNVGVSETDEAPQTVTIQKPANTSVFLAGIAINSGGNYTDKNGQRWRCDVVDFSRGVYEQNIRKYVFNGDEDWGSLSADSRAFYLKLGAKGYGRYGITMCDKLPYDGTVTDGSNRAVGFRVLDSSAKNGFCIFLRLPEKYTEITTTAKFKQWLAENPLTVYIALTEPVEIPLSTEELAQYATLHTNYPHTTIFNDGGAGMEVKYVADTKLYIDKKFAELSTALLNQ